MATGIYGTVRCADVNINDIEAFYAYQATRGDKITKVVQLNASQIVQKIDDPNDAGLKLGGLYNLTLPSSIFNAKGYYTLLIRPKRIRTVIRDCAVLSASPTIKGIVLDLQDIPSSDQYRFENNGLNGYRVEYKKTDATNSEEKLESFFTIVTSNNRVEPTSENLTNTTQKAVRYRLNDNSTLVFCTVSPSSSSEANPNLQPFLGAVGQEIFLIPTTFDPIIQQIELVEHDIDTIAIGLFGDQSFAVKEGIRTYYNEEGEIYKQFNEYVVKDDVSLERLYDVKEERDNIDFDKNLDNIT